MTHLWQAPADDELRAARQRLEIDGDAELSLEVLEALFVLHILLHGLAVVELEILDLVEEIRPEVTELLPQLQQQQQHHNHNT